MFIVYDCLTYCGPWYALPYKISQNLSGPLLMGFLGFVTKKYYQHKFTLFPEHGFGIRHLQIACMTFNLVSLIIARASMAVAVLAMSDTTRKSSAEVQVSTISIITLKKSSSGLEEKPRRVNGYFQ
jgi:hypothetical protein